MAALVEREIAFDFSKLTMLRLALRNPDFTTAKRIAASINEFLGAPVAEPTNPGTVGVKVPPRYAGNMVQLLTDVEQLRVEPDQPAKVVIDEQSGIIVMGKDVRVSEVAIAQGNLTVTITETPQVAMPAPFTNANPVVVPRTGITVNDGAGNKLATLREGVTLRELVDGLNALGVGPRDLISILQAIKAAGRPAGRNRGDVMSDAAASLYAAGKGRILAAPDTGKSALPGTRPGQSTRRGPRTSSWCSSRP